MGPPLLRSYTPLLAEMDATIFTTEVSPGLTDVTVVAVIARGGRIAVIVSVGIAIVATAIIAKAAQRSAGYDACCDSRPKAATTAAKTTAAVSAAGKMRAAAMKAATTAESAADMSTSARGTRHYRRSRRERNSQRSRADRFKSRHDCLSRSLIKSRIKRPVAADVPDVTAL